MASLIPAIKLLLLGDSGVGKSSILLKFVEDRFLGEDALNPTIGVDYKYKIIERDGQKYKLAIWDTAGQEKFRTVTSTYYRGAQGVVVVYDVTDRSSFEHLSYWISELENYNGDPNVVKIIVGNKIDRENTRAVTRKEGQEFAKSCAALFVETSAKTKDGILQCFDELVIKVLQQLQHDQAAASRGSLDLQHANAGQSGVSRYCGC